jgi:integrase/recombinase XerD
MSLTKQAKTLTKAQEKAINSYLGEKRNSLRNKLIFNLSIKAGLRAKEIANLKWIHIIGNDGILESNIYLPNIASKGNSGRIIPLNSYLKKILSEQYEICKSEPRFDPLNDFVITTERSKRTSPQVIVNFFQSLYKELGLLGCSSHSGRRTFITSISKKISTVGGSMRDVQYLAGHSSLNTTQRYIEGSSESKTRVVDLI